MLGTGAVRATEPRLRDLMRVVSVPHDTVGKGQSISRSRIAPRSRLDVPSVIGRHTGRRKHGWRAQRGSPF